MDHFQSDETTHPRQREDKLIAQFTLQDGLRAIEKSAKVKVTSRIRLRSQLKAFEKVVGKPLLAIAATPQNIRQLISKAKPGAHNFKPSYWKAVCGAVWLALRLLGIETMGRKRQEVPAEWKPIIAPLPYKPHKVTLTPFIRAVSDLGIAPADLDQSTSLKIRGYIKKNHKRTSWQRSYRRAFGIVKRCQTDYPDLWPQNPIEVVFENDGHYTLRWSSFPSLEAETDRMIAELSSRATGVVLEGSTVTERKYCVLKIASAMVRHLDREPSSITSLLDIANSEAVENYINFILKRGGKERSGYLSQACRHAIAIAKYHTTADAAVVEALKRIKKTVQRPKGAARKNKDLLMLFRDPLIRRKFKNIPEEIIKGLAKKPFLTPLEKTLGSIAFAAYFLLRRPLRVSELVALEFGKNVFDRGQGKNRRVVVHLDADDVKNDIDRDFMLSDNIVKMMDICVAKFSPDKVCNKNALFPGFGKRNFRNPHSLSQALAKLMSDRLGFRVTAHQWRMIAGYLFLLKNPGNYETVRRFLGHASIDVTTDYYAFMLVDDAFAALDTAIEATLDTE